MVTQIQCGCCTKKITKEEKDIEDDQKYYKVCNLCDKKYQIKPVCARAMYTATSNGSMSTIITIDNFRNIISPMFCNQCRQTKCFYCEKAHPCKCNVYIVKCINQKYYLIIRNHTHLS